MARLLRMPEVAAGGAAAVLSDWPLAERDAFAAGDVIATVETEKAVVDVPADADGVLLKTLVTPGAEVEVGAPVAVLGEPGEVVGDLGALLRQLGVGAAGGDAAPKVPSTAELVELGASTTAETPAPRPASATAPPAERNGARGRVFASPIARRLARDAGLAVEDLEGTGPGGRIVRRDVELALSRRVSPPTPPGAASDVPPQQVTGYEEVPHSRLRRAVAERLTRSVRDAPHFYLRGSARVDELLRVRAALNDGGRIKVSVTDLVVMAAARAHVLVPEMNVLWTPDAVRRFRSVDVGIAVATDRGLVTPVLRGVDRLPVSAVAATRADLVERARAGRLQQQELEGGTLTVTNLGGYGVEEFAAILNPPQSAILAVGAAREEAVVEDGQLAVATVVRMTLSADHRPIDGVLAARWMSQLRSLLENPVRILA